MSRENVEEINPYSLTTPEEVAATLAQRVREQRLDRGWRQATLAERSGVTLGSLRRFETTGKISLQSLLKLAFALRRLDDFEALLNTPQPRSLAELEARTSKPRRQRGRR